MILPTNIEPANRGTAFGQVPNGVRASWMEPTVETRKIGERWLVVVGSEDAESRCLSFVQRFAKGEAEIHWVRPSGPDPANEVRRLAITLEVDWLCLVAERGVGLMSLFLRSDVERILRAAPCPVVCIPETIAPGGNEDSWRQDFRSVRRILVPIKPSPNSRWIVEQAVGVAERLRAKLDLLGVVEVVRNPEGSPVVSRRNALRMQNRAIRYELAHLAEARIPKRMRGRRLISAGFPLFYATTRWARELNSHLVMHAAPTRLWTSEGRIDGGTERILHSAGCPVICIPERGDLITRPREAVASVKQCHRRSDWHTPPRLSLRPRPRPVPKCKDFSAMRHELVVSNTNLKRFDTYETQITGS